MDTGSRGSGRALGRRRSAGERGARCAKPFVFTGIPDQDESRLVERFGKVATYLEAKLGVPVRYIPVKNTRPRSTAFTNGQVQLAWFGGFHRRPGPQGGAGQPSHRAGGGGRGLQDLLHRQRRDRLAKGADFPKGIAGKSFTFGSRASTSGRLMPEFFIRQAFPGKTPEEVFERVGFSGDHSRTIQLVQSGAFAVGALDYSVWIST